MRKDLTSRSASVGTVTHGVRLDVIETRRRFVRVRTEQGLEGWTDASLLLTSQQMDDLTKLAEGIAKLPSQGKATTFDVLNMHTDANRQSPGFFQLPEGASVDVVSHRVAPRTQPIAPKPAPIRRASTKKEKQKSSKQAAYLLPPPSPPKIPSNWEALSRPRAPDLSGYTPPAAAPEHAPPPMDDWSLVRTRDNRVGWVLSRALMMAIPDEVAQYAEGHRITAYVPLGSVKDGDQLKPNWLWTTTTGGAYPYEFDSFRVFVWSTRRHRYETAYIERNVIGYYPIEADAKPGDEETAFSVVLEDKDGHLYKRTYAFSGYHVRMVKKEPYERPSELPGVRPANGFTMTAAERPVENTWKRRLVDWRGWLKR